MDGGDTPTIGLSSLRTVQQVRGVAWMVYIGLSSTSEGRGMAWMVFTIGGSYMIIHTLKSM